MDTPDKSHALEVYKAAIGLLGKHLVCLCGSYVQLDPNKEPVGAEKMFAVSGFIMSFDDV